MKKYFKSRRRINVLKIFKSTMYVFLLMGILLLSKNLLNFKLIESNREFIDYLLNSSNLVNSNFKTNFDYLFKKTGVNNPSNMIKNVFTTEYEKGDIIIMNYAENKEQNEVEVNNEVEQNNEVEVTNKVEQNNEPIVYIYNTHQGEEYVGGNVINGGRLLKEKLDSVGVPSIFEEADILDFMRVNNYNHAQSYIASSYYIKETLNNFNNLKLIIDFHRDSAPKSSTTTVINGKECARVLFVVGLEHDNYKVNLDLANKLNNMINSKYSTLSRGVMQKEGPGVNGIYNQNLSSNMILLEFGAEENTFLEVSNTIDLIKDIIKEYIDEEKN
ncbi:MAG: stage II sporulation protein P [Bacilli bacterium]|nr:stage II sporulation protein P [Bacilli bacterium]